MRYETPLEHRADSVVIGTSRVVPAWCLAIGLVTITVKLGIDPRFSVPPTLREIPGDFLLGWGMLLFIFGLWKLIDNPPTLILDDDGFTDCSGHLGRIAWDQIAAVRTGRHTRP